MALDRTGTSVEGGRKIQGRKGKKEEEEGDESQEEEGIKKNNAILQLLKTITHFHI